MRSYIVISTVLFLALSQFLSQSTLRYFEPLFLAGYLYVVGRKGAVHLIGLGPVFALGQIITSIANGQLIGMLIKGGDGGMYHYVVPEFIPEGLTIHFLGSALFLFGYTFYNNGRALVQNTIKQESLKYLFVAAILILLNRYFIGFALPGAFNSLLTWTPIASTFILSRIGYAEDSKQLRLYAVILMGVVIVMAFLFATLRVEMIWPIIAYFLGVFMAKPQISFFLTPRFYPFYIGGFFFFLFFMAFQQIRGTSSGTDRVSAIFEAQKELEYQEYEDDGAALLRQADLAQITNCVELTNGNEFKRGETVAILGVALIPRFLWPNKPLIALGVWFAVKIGQALETENGWYNTSINMSVPGHLYLEFGWMGLVFGSLLIGLFFKFLWTSCALTSQSNNFTGSLLGSFLLTNLVSGLGADLQILVTLLALFLIVLALSSFIRFVAPA